MMLIPTLLLIVVGLLLFGIYVDRVESDSRIADVDDELSRAQRGANRLVQDLDDGPGSDRDASPPEDVSGVDPPVQLVVASDGMVLAHNSQTNPFDETTVARLYGTEGFVTVPETNYRALVTPGRGGRAIITALPLDGVDAARNEFRRALIAGGLTLVALQGALVWLLTTRLLRPVTRMTETATRVAAGELDTPIGTPSGSRETAQLAVDLDRMLARMKAAIDESEASANDALQARDDMQRFLEDVSHEIRTPLTALRGYSDLYSLGMLEEPGALDRAMGRVGHESQRLHGLVDNMLRLARNSATADTLESIAVGPMVSDIVLDLRAAFPDHTIEAAIDPAATRPIRANASQIHQSILNLGANACQHTEPSRTNGSVDSRADICIAVSASDTELTVRVVDHGPGIDPGHAQRIFLPFFRADSSRSRNGHGGAGLGLALTKQIVERHEGKIAYIPTPGGGATFTMTFPFEHAEVGGMAATTGMVER